MSDFCATCGISPDSINELTEKEVNNISDNTHEYILFSTNCPKCKILEKKMEEANLSFTVSDDIQLLIEKGFRSAPVLYCKTADKYLAFGEAVKYINGLNEEEE